MNETWKRYIVTCKRLASKLAKAKAKLVLLSHDVDLFTSLNIRIGKKFDDIYLEGKKDELLKICKRDILGLSKMEAVHNLKQAREDLRYFFEREDVQALSFPMYKNLSNICYAHENETLDELSTLHCRKIENFARKHGSDVQRTLLLPDKKFKHKKKRKFRRREKQRKKRAKKAAEMLERQKSELKEIKSSNLVINFSDGEIPDEVYFYLALGSSFVPTKVQDKHDYIFDAKNFCRKLAWSFFHNQRVIENEVNQDRISASPQNTIEDSQINNWETSPGLKIKGRTFPDLKHNKKQFDIIHKKLLADVANISLHDKKWSNLTPMEKQGLKWCQRAIKDHRLYFTKADKGGSVLILNGRIVHDIILSNIKDETKFVRLKKDPRNDIKRSLKLCTLKFENEGLLSREDCFLISGQTEKGGMSHSPSFCVKKPHVYPNFKVHKLTEDMIENKIIPPVRMVTSGVAGPTHRIGMFLDAVLQPVVKKYCDGEIVKDTTSFLASLIDMKENKHLERCNLIGTLDVDALYPSIKIKYIEPAIRHALSTCTAYSVSQVNMIIEFVNISINNAVIHYRGEWFKAIVGIPTGGSDSGSIANIFVKWALDQNILLNPEVRKHNKMNQRKRFLDDIWFLWFGTTRNFDSFLKAFNEVGREYGITLKGEVSDNVNFLDVTTMLVNKEIRTCLFIKPTDAKRYLHRKSDHSPHTFKSTPYSQFSRAIILCSDQTDQRYFIDYMFKKFRDSGYKDEELEREKVKALKINRLAILDGANSNSNVKKTKEDTLTFVINHDRIGSSEIRKIVRSNQEMINYLFGKEVNIVVAERRSPNTASLLFAKSGFARELSILKESQRCSSKGCFTCDNIGIEKSIVLNGFHVKLDFSLDCNTENVIYLYICKHCPDNKEFYFGQTNNCLRERANGHRAGFADAKYKKSAMSYHIWEEHRELFHQKLNNFKVGIVKSTSPDLLDRTEDFYVIKTDADVVGLNRYKVVT